MECDTSESLLKKINDGDEKLTNKVWDEMKKMWIVAGPAIFTRFSTFGVSIISLAFIGHIGATELAAYALVSTVIMRFANGILLGMASALETLCGQAYGAKQNHMMAFSITTHVFLSWILTIKYKYGISGAMISTILAFWIPNIGQLLFVLCGGCPETWRGFSVLAFKDLWPVIKLSLSSGVMLCLELWYNTVLILLTGNMKNAEVAIDALSICLNINGWEMMIAFGFLAAASVRVANELGRGSSSAAKFSILMIVLTSFSIGFVLFIFFLFFRGHLAYLFTDNRQVAAAVADLSPLLACSILLNSVQPVLSGVAIGSGKQSIIAFVNIGCYYLVGIPIGVVLGYVLNLQVKGVWLGMLLGTLAQTIVLMVITYRTDWNKQVSIAQQRLKKWEVKPEQTDHDSQGV